MKLSTGKKKFEIEFDNGDVDYIYFNPNDPDLGIRMVDFQKKVDEKMNSLNDVKISADGNASEEQDKEAVEIVREAQDIIKEELDRAFNSEISSVVFKYCSPFAVVNGTYFILAFLEGIMPEIEKEIEKSTQDFRPNELLAKYGK